MQILPAIDLLGGQCVRLYQGDYEKSQVYHKNPVIVAQQWQAQGATRLHLVDLDGAKAGEPINLEAIAEIVDTLTIPVQVGGGLRNRERVKQLLMLGVERVILGTVAVENPDLVNELCAEFPGQIVVGIDARNGKVATRGWIETSEIEAMTLAQQMEKQGAAAIIYTDIHCDGTMSGPNLDALRTLASALTIPVIASGGVSRLQDLMNLLTLEAIGVQGAIVGKALYTDDIQLTEAIQAVGDGRLQDVPPADAPRFA